MFILQLLNTHTRVSLMVLNYGRNIIIIVVPLTMTLQLTFSCNFSQSQ